MYEGDIRRYVFELIAGIHVRTRKLLQDELSRLDLTYPQYGVLAILERHDQLSQQNLADELHTDSTTIMVICTGLERKGFIKRSRDKRDRRRYMVHLTADARVQLSKAHMTVEELVNRATRGTGLSELEAMRGTLERLFGDVTRTASEQSRK